LRDDLFYRISTITIHVPPLRERSEDTQMLAEHCRSRTTVNSTENVVPLRKRPAAN